MKESSGQETGESGRRAGALAAPTLAEESQDQNCAYGSVRFQLFRPAGHESALWQHELLCSKDKHPRHIMPSSLDSDLIGDTCAVPKLPLSKHLELGERQRLPLSASPSW